MIEIPEQFYNSSSKYPKREEKLRTALRLISNVAEYYQGYYTNSGPFTDIIEMIKLALAERPIKMHPEVIGWIKKGKPKDNKGRAVR